MYWPRSYETPSFLTAMYLSFTRKSSVVLDPKKSQLIDPKMLNFSSILSDSKKILKKSKKVEKVESMKEAEIDEKWLRKYEAIGRRVKEGLDFCFYFHQYEPSFNFYDFSGEYLERKKWNVRSDLEKQRIMRPIKKYEWNYINVAGYFM